MEGKGGGKMQLLMVPMYVYESVTFIDNTGTTICLILNRRQVVEGVTECTLDLGELPKRNYLPPVQY